MRLVRVLLAPVCTAALVAPVFATPAEAATAPLKFGKWVADPPGNDLPANNVKVNREYISVTNTTSKTIALTGYRVRDKKGHVFVFHKGTSLGAKKTVRVHSGSGKNTATDVYWKQGFYVWNNGGDTAYLEKPNKKLITTCTYKKNATGTRYC